jgi:hypothetical protein
MIEELEEKYKKHYAKCGDNMPAFPERYVTSSLIGRVDLVDVLPLDEYHDTVPKVLQE